MRLAMIQMQVTADKEQNVETACRRIRIQAGHGAQICILPEMFCCPYDTTCFHTFCEAPGGPAQAALSELARELEIYIVAGSLPELSDGRIYNTSFVYSPEGTVIARHRKMHLFDIDIKDAQHFHESDVFSAGDDITLFDTPWGRFGLCICFDIRFAELARLMALGGAQAIIVPAAFNRTTGPLHWELHFRARAVDNQLFTIGVAPASDENAGYISYAHSIVCDPWGRVLLDAGTGDSDSRIELDFYEVQAFRAQVPILSARRTDVYSLTCLRQKLF